MIPRNPRSLALVAAVLALISLISCKVDFSDQLRYACAKDADCGGDGFVCAPNPARAVCCKPSGPETCDGVDNNCDGFVDNTARQETCNGEDDDCNGKVDDGYDLKTNSNHCGACNHACANNEFCRDGACIVRLESQCFDGFDDDGNGKIDCADPSCDQRSCGASCVCRNLQKAEDRCDDGVDNEMDGVKDCADPDCTGNSCRTGCTCVADGGQTETGCDDGVDNDLDGRADCLDVDCVGRYCTPPDIYFQCTADQKCKCNGGVQIAESGAVLCRDGVDNDCDGQLDCAETTCIGQSCNTDGGTGCECGGGGKKEVGCANLVDDDGDGKTDCADPDCLAGTTCTKPDGGGGGTCASSACQ